MGQAAGGKAVIFGNESRSDWLKGLLAFLAIPAIFVIAGCGPTREDPSPSDNYSFNLVNLGIEKCKDHGGLKLVESEAHTTDAAVLCEDQTAFAVDQ